VSTRIVRAASRLRGERAIHAPGIALTGWVDVPGGARLGIPVFDGPGRYRALVRFSRGAGLPRGLPDVLGIAVRLLDAGGPGRDQDLLMATGARSVVLRSLPLPRLDLLGSWYSSVAPYRANGRRLLVGAQPLPSRPSGAARVVALDRLRDVLPLRLRLVVATMSGPWQAVGTLTADAVLPAPEGRLVRFDPYTDGGGLVPVGVVNRVRRGAYPASHVGPDA